MSDEVVESLLHFVSESDCLQIPSLRTLASSWMGIADGQKNDFYPPH